MKTEKQIKWEAIQESQRQAKIKAKADNIAKWNAIWEEQRKAKAQRIADQSKQWEISNDIATLDIEGVTVTIDKSDSEHVSQFNWSLRKGSHTSYAITYQGPDGSMISMHRLVMGLDGPIVDHKDGNGLNNRRSNLRHASNALNAANSRKSTKPCSSRFKGVNWETQKAMWRARIKTNQKKLSLGYFTSEVDAAKAYDAKAVELWGEFAKTNFPIEGIGMGN